MSRWFELAWLAFWGAVAIGMVMAASILSQDPFAAGMWAGAGIWLGMDIVVQSLSYSLRCRRRLKELRAPARALSAQQEGQ